MNEKINDIVYQTINDNSLVKINKNLFLKKYQMDILDYYKIDYKSCNSVSEVLFLIEDVLTNDDLDYEKLEEVALSLQEFNYYNNTNK